MTQNELEFNPKPLIRLFEGVSSQLETVRQGATVLAEALTKQTSAQSTAHEKDVDRMRSATQQVFRIFDELNESLNSVSSTALEMGQQLETADRIRNRAIEAHHVTIALDQASKGNLDILSAFKSSGPDGERHAALLLRRLLALSRELEAHSEEMILVRPTLSTWKMKCREGQRTISLSFELGQTNYPRGQRTNGAELLGQL